MLGWSKDCDGPGKAIAGLATAKESITLKENTNTLIPLENVEFDEGNFFNNDGKVHIESDGVYLITAEIYYDYYANKTAGTAWVTVCKNGSQYIAEGSVCPNQNSVGVSPTTSIIVRLKKGDYLEIMGATAGVASPSATIVPNQSRLSIAKWGD